MTFAGYVLQQRGISILNEYNEELPGLSKDSENRDIIPSRPYIIVDTFGTPTGNLEPQWHDLTYEEVLKLGYVIVVRRGGWFAGQQVNYILMHKSKAGSERKMDRFPNKHYVKYDSANKIFKFMGRNVSPQGIALIKL